MLSEGRLTYLLVNFGYLTGKLEGGNLHARIPNKEVNLSLSNFLAETDNRNQVITALGSSIFDITKTEEFRNNI